MTVTSESCILCSPVTVFISFHPLRLEKRSCCSLLENANLLNAIEFLHTARNVSSMEVDAHPGDDLSRDVLRASV